MLMEQLFSSNIKILILNPDYFPQKKMLKKFAWMYLNWCVVTKSGGRGLTKNYTSRRHNMRCTPTYQIAIQIGWWWSKITNAHHFWDKWVQTSDCSFRVAVKWNREETGMELKVRKSGLANSGRCQVNYSH